jgi:hypothetical protein
LHSTHSYFSNWGQKNVFETYDPTPPPHLHDISGFHGCYYVEANFSEACPDSVSSSSYTSLSITIINVAWDVNLTVRQKSQFFYVAECNPHVEAAANCSQMLKLMRYGVLTAVFLNTQVLWATDCVDLWGMSEVPKNNDASIFRTEQSKKNAGWSRRSKNYKLQKCRKPLAQRHSVISHKIRVFRLKIVYQTTG